MKLIEFQDRAAEKVNEALSLINGSVQSAWLWHRERFRYSVAEMMALKQDFPEYRLRFGPQVLREIASILDVGAQRLLIDVVDAIRKSRHFFLAADLVACVIGRINSEPRLQSSLGEVAQAQSRMAEIVFGDSRTDAGVRNLTETLNAAGCFISPCDVAALLWALAEIDDAYWRPFDGSRFDDVMEDYALERERSPEAALRFIGQAIAIRPSDPSLLEMRAELYDILSEHAKAAADRLTARRLRDEK